MGFAVEGGTPFTKLVTVNATATALTPARINRTAQYRSALVIQNVGAADVYIGGSNVVATGAAGDPVGLVIPGVPSPQTTPPTPPQAIALSTTGAALYGIVAAGTGSVVVYEEIGG
jgi:hypothetical protein